MASTLIPNTTAGGDSRLKAEFRAWVDAERRAQDQGVKITEAMAQLTDNEVAAIYGLTPSDQVAIDQLRSVPASWVGTKEGDAFYNQLVTLYP